MKLNYTIIDTITGRNITQEMHFFEKNVVKVCLPMKMLFQKRFFFKVQSYLCLLNIIFSKERQHEFYVTIRFFFCYSGRRRLYENPFNIRICRRRACCKLGGWVVVLVEGDSLVFEKGMSPIELLKPEDLHDLIERIRA